MVHGIIVLLITLGLNIIILLKNRKIKKLEREVMYWETFRKIQTDSKKRCERETKTKN